LPVHVLILAEIPAVNDARSPEKTMNFRLLLIGIPLIVVACTTTDEIIIDEKGVDMSHYQDDLSECSEYSKQVAVAEKGARGAASGAVVGGLIGAVGGGHHSTSEAAGTGAVVGGAKGINEGDRDKVKVVKNCLRGRGYKILN
jgi:outer membrane lipoprotein SlyB